VLPLPEGTGSKWSMLAFLRLWWWQPTILRGSHEHGKTADDTDLQKLTLHPGFSYAHQILPFPSDCDEDDFRSKSRVLWQSVWLKGRYFNMLEYSQHRLFFSPHQWPSVFFILEATVAITEWHPERIELDRLITSNILYRLVLCFEVSNT
jgi:hypothetical protein